MIRNVLSVANNISKIAAMEVHMVELGILDYVQINEGSSPKQALEETLALDKYYEANGFK